jgi:hypothetical protein
MLTSVLAAEESSKSFAQQDPTTIREVVIGGPQASLAGDLSKIARDRHDERDATSRATFTELVVMQPAHGVKLGIARGNVA